MTISAEEQVTTKQHSHLIEALKNHITHSNSLFYISLPFFAPTGTQTHTPMSLYQLSHTWGTTAYSPLCPPCVDPIYDST